MARRLAKPKPVADGQISKIGKVATLIGQFQAADADAAIRLAIDKYDIEPKYQNRVAARPIVKA